MKRLSKEDLDHLLLGAVILGAGGGGDIEEGRELIDTALSAGKTFDLVSVDEVPDDKIICTPYLLGAISPMSAEEERAYEGLEKSDINPLLQAYSEFQTHLGKDFYGTTACELGGSNTAAAFFPAVMNGHKIIDADPAGRAVPEITHSTYFLAGLPAAPIYAVNEFGESFVLNNVKDDRRAETLVRALSQVSRNSVAAIDHALPMRDLREALIPGTISKAIELGKICQTCTTDTAQAIAAAAQGVVLFEGKITTAEYRLDQGFTVGQILIEGLDQHKGSSMKVSVKNENMVCWLDGNVVATVPDLICLFDKETGQPIANPDAYSGQTVSLVVLPAPAPFTSEIGLSIFGPSYVGLDLDFRSPTAVG